MKNKVIKIQGVGINDANYNTSMTDINGVKVLCPFYRRWRLMLMRCYGSRYLKDNPTYEGCYVCESWLSFSNFKVWMEVQKWEGNVLDKDLILEGNKVYCPEYCCFIPTRVNNLLVLRANDRSEHGLGVRKKLSGTYCAMISIHGKDTMIGTYESKEDAHNAYLRAKSAYILTFVDEFYDIRIRSGLISAAASFIDKISEALP